MRDEDILAQARGAFMEEARELLAQLESSLLSLAESPDRETVDAAFRAAHTIKGSAGLFGLEPVVAFTHHVEALLERLRAGELPVTDPVVTLLLECRDQIERLLDAVSGTEQAADHSAESERLVGLLRRVGGTAAEPPPGRDSGSPRAAGAPAAAAAPAPSDWVVQARFGADTFAMGFDPLSFLRYLPTVGEVVAAHALLDDIPPLDRLEPEQCHVGVVLRLATQADKRAIESVFDFVADSVELRLLPPARQLDEMRALLDEHADDGARIGELLVHIGALTERELAVALDAQRAADAPPGARPRLGEQLVERGMVAADVVHAAVERQSQVRERKSDEQRYVRVKADKLDALISLIGELVIAGSAAQILAGQRADSELADAANRICSLVEGARDHALQLRMVPIGETFSRFKRVVHEVGRALGKDVELVVTGGDTELDKSMVDQIADPLTHLVRNALDHGLESPEARAAAGKPPHGRLTLHAYHESGSVVIEVADDGRGLSRERILAKARERGLVAAGAEPGDDEVWQLIFLPGFSTAEQVTDLSGRGVGMDVVRRNIEALRGSISIASETGVGTRMSIRLPLTLAIIDGFLVGVGPSRFVFPLDTVVEVIESKAGAGSITELRGKVLPVIDLRQLYGLESPAPERCSVVVIQAGGTRYGVRVDRLLGQHQTVIKPLGRLFRGLRGIAGSTILGSGEVALILDMAALCRLAEQPPPAAAFPARAPVPTPDNATVH
jgi:two-component system chemotaxis sensor kinase CheA